MEHQPPPPIRLQHARFVINARSKQAYTIASHVWLDLWEDTHTDVIHDILIRITSTVQPFTDNTLRFLFFTHKIARLYRPHPSQSVTYITHTPYDYSLQIIFNIHKFIAKSLLTHILKLRISRPTINRLARELNKSGTIQSIRESISRHMRNITLS